MPVCRAGIERQDYICACVIMLLSEVEEIIIFVKGNWFNVNPEFDERGKFIRHANTNIALRKSNVILRERLLCYKIRDKKDEIVVAPVKANIFSIYFKAE